MKPNNSCHALWHAFLLDELGEVNQQRKKKKTTKNNTESLLAYAVWAVFSAVYRGYWTFRKAVRYPLAYISSTAHILFRFLLIFYPKHLAFIAKRTHAHAQSCVANQQWIQQTKMRTDKCVSEATKKPKRRPTNHPSKKNSMDNKRKYYYCGIFRCFYAWLCVSLSVMPLKKNILQQHDNKLSHYARCFLPLYWCKYTHFWLKFKAYKSHTKLITSVNQNFFVKNQINQRNLTNDDFDRFQLMNLLTWLYYIINANMQFHISIIFHYFETIVHI